MDSQVKSEPQSNKSEKDPDRWIWWAVIGSICFAFAVFAITTIPALYAGGDSTYKAERGDFWGGHLGATFSFLGVIFFFIALLMQKAELRLQRNELAESRQVFEEQVKQLEEQTKIAARRAIVSEIHEMTTLKATFEIESLKMQKIGYPGEGVEWSNMAKKLQQEYRDRIVVLECQISELLKSNTYE
ncbi:MAG: hypothetical protein DWQ01_08690 [Planctomycetota bacterium]|nr:MAG: hypothetical protein DWQ01_08690 [Planctomycetota bacterium]